MELFNPAVAVENLGPLFAGLLMTVELTFVVIVLSLVFALLVALGGMSRFRPLRWLVKAYIEIIRGTPLLLQLVYIYYVLPEVGIRLNPFTAGVIGLTLNYRPISPRSIAAASRPSGGASTMPPPPSA